MDSRLITEEVGCPVPKMGQPSFSQSVLDVEVSYFESLKDKTPKTVNLLSFLESTAHKSQVEKIRCLEDQELIKQAKAKLPSITPSGLFSGRTDDSLVQHSGLIQIDIDYKDNKNLNDYETLKTKFKKVNNIAYCGLSASGQGYWCLIPIAHPGKHREHFRALQRILAKRNLIIDKSGSNLSRRRFVSYDPEPYFNHQAKVLMVYDEPQAELYHGREIDTTEGESASKIRALVAAVEQNRIDLTTVYGDWFKLGRSIANSIGDDGREYFHQLSQFHPEYSRRRADYEYDKCLAKKDTYKITLGTLFYHCKQAGIT